MKMKRKNILIILCIGVLCFLCMKEMASAASASVIITTEDTSVKQGEKLTITVIAESSAIIGDFEAYISYDAEILEFDTGGSYVTGGEGMLHILEMGSGNHAVVKKYALQFYAKKDGKCQISVNDRPVALEADTGEQMSVSKNSLSITVGKGKEKRNNNRKLKSLTISNGTLEPEFSAANTEYQVTVGSHVDTLFVIAKPDYIKSTVNIEGNENLKIGQNTINIEVTSQAGEIRNYILHVKKMSAEEEALEQPEEQAEETPKPEAEEEAITIYTKEEKTYIKNVSQYETAELQDKSLIPSGYIETSLMLGGKKITAYTLKNDLDNYFLLMYLRHEEEEPQFYLYDRKEKTLQRYQKDSKMIIDNNNNSNTPIMTKDEYRRNIVQLTIVIAIETAVCALLLAGLIRSYLKSRKKEDEDDFGI